MRTLSTELALVLATAFCAGVWAAGAREAAAPTKITEITQLAWDRGTVPPQQGTIEDNWWTRYVNERVAKLGIKVRFVPIPRAQETQKLPLMLAAGEAPDLCFTYDRILLNLYVKNGALVDFTELFAKDGENIRKIYTDADLEVGKINGRLYTFVCKTNGAADTTFIRKDWLDKLGLKAPTSVKEFHDTLKAIKTKDPGGVGDRLVAFALQGGATTSFTLWDSVVLPGFVKDPPSGERLVVPVPLWPETKDALRFLNTLYAEGLLGEFILDKDGTLFKQRVIRGEMASFVAFGHWPYHPAYGSVYEKLVENQPEARLTSIWPWKHPSSPEPWINFFRNSPYLYQFFSPKTAKNPELVMKYLDWLASEEGYKVATLGLEGVDYTLKDGVPIAIDDKSYAERVSWIEPQYMAFTKPFTGPGQEQLYMRNSAKLFAPSLREQFIKESYPMSRLRFWTPRLSLPTPTADKYQAALARKWEEAIAKIVTAPPAQFDALFDEAVKSYRAEGGDEVAKELVEVYKQQYGK